MRLHAAACLIVLLAACTAEDAKPQPVAAPPAEKPRRPVPVDPLIEFCGEQWPSNTYNVKCSSAEVTNLGALASLSELSMLTLEGAKLADGNLEVLKSLPKLRTLRLIGCTIPASGFATIGEQVHLEQLNLDNSNLDDAGLAKLSPLVELNELEIGGTAVSDAGLVHLGKMQKLRSLDLRSSKLTGAGFRHLVDLPALAFLDLTDAEIGDEVLKEVAALKHLVSLDLSGTDVSYAGLQKLGAEGAGDARLELRGDFGRGDRQAGASVARLSDLDRVSDRELAPWARRCGQLRANVLVYQKQKAPDFGAVG